MTENIVTGKKYRILTDAANDIWDRISFWSKASDVQYDDNTTAEANKAVAILKRNASYTVGTVAYEPSAPSWVLLKCTQAGTTAAVIPSTYSTISSVGTVITDGTAHFTVYDVRPSNTLSNSAYQVPTMALVNNLNSELTANGNKFYFDYQNSKYGYNTSASRAAATFVPFENSDFVAAYGGGFSPSNAYARQAGIYKNGTGVATGETLSDSYITLQIGHYGSYGDVKITPKYNMIVSYCMNYSNSVHSTASYIQMSANVMKQVVGQGYSLIIHKLL